MGPEGTTGQPRPLGPSGRGRVPVAFVTQRYIWDFFQCHQVWSRGLCMKPVELPGTQEVTIRASHKGAEGTRLFLRGIQKESPYWHYRARPARFRVMTRSRAGSWQSPGPCPTGMCPFQFEAFCPQPPCCHWDALLFVLFWCLGKVKWFLSHISCFPPRATWTLFSVRTLQRLF